ncbi:cyanophycinase [Pedobacter yulinensis]|uniref:Cyanophycinase n=1 Tax=Pedobacter yulinensis TaxID=2126353 RepID=A0A2T3HGS3_9SPHI|nr:cyanophycinase [Pedobacter yulinensis]PST81637.1 cyanophycinase [Pedobacter yulinensis]
MRKLLTFLCCIAFSASVCGCSKTATNAPDGPPPGAGQVNRRPASLGVAGDTANVNAPVQGGLVLMGGGADVAAAFKWMIARSGGGDVVIIRASGTDAYNSYVNDLGQVNSVETLKIDSRQLADNDSVAYIIRNAEMLFIAGGDQSNYMDYWKNTKTAAAINYLLNVKKAPVGGTSAGCAILGAAYFSGEKGSAVSADVLKNPYDETVALWRNDFLEAPFLHQVITDQHFLARSREGRLLTFLARASKDWAMLAKGIAADERTAVCIDQAGLARVYGSSKAYFVLPEASKLPEQVVPGLPLKWDHNGKAVRVYEIAGTTEGNGIFDVATFNIEKAAGGAWYWWSVSDAELHKQQQQ